MVRSSPLLVLLLPLAAAAGILSQDEWLAPSPGQTLRATAVSTAVGAGIGALIGLAIKRWRMIDR